MKATATSQLPQLANLPPKMGTRPYCGHMEWIEWIQDGNQVVADTNSSADLSERTTWHRDLLGRVTSKEYADDKK